MPLWEKPTHQLSQYHFYRDIMLENNKTTLECLYTELLYWEQSTNKTLVRHTLEMQSNTGRYSFIHMKRMKPVFGTRYRFIPCLILRTVTLVYIEHLKFWQDEHAYERYQLVNLQWVWLLEICTREKVVQKANWVMVKRRGHFMNSLSHFNTATPAAASVGKGIPL